MNSAFNTKVLLMSNSSFITDVHLRSFPSFFLSTLGRNFLYHFYRAILSNNNGYGIGLFYEENLIGFAIGTKQSNGFYKELLKKHFVTFIYSAFKPLITNPSSIKRLLTNLRNSNNLELPEFCHTLLSICILPEYQNKNLGGFLLENFENISISKNSKYIYLTTETLNNDKVNNFYVSKKYILKGNYITYPDRSMNQYLKKIIVE